MPQGNDQVPAETSAEAIWQSILRVTECAGDELKSLRVLLFVALTDGQTENWRDRLRCFRKLARWYLVPRKKIAKAAKGHPLFAFIFDTPANMNNLSPVYQSAIRRSLKPTVLCGEKVNFEPANQAQCCVGIRELMGATTFAERLAALACARKLHKVLCAHFSSGAPQFHDKVRRRCAWIISELAIFLAVRHGLRRLYSEWRPSCVVSTSDLWPFDHAVFAEAVNQRIPSFVIQHGLTNRYWWPCVAGKLLLWGSAFHRELLGMGAPPSRLAICGMPASDHLFMRFQREGKEFTPRPVKSCVILSDTQSQATHPLLYLKFKDLLKATVSSTPFIKWSVKLHPIEDDVFYKDFMGCHNFAVLPKTTTLEQAVMGADAACTLWSTSGLEAMMMKRPLFVLDVEPVIREFAWWPKFGGGFFASNAGALIGLLEKASADESFTVQALRKQDEFLRQNFANAGGAADAALDLIQEIVGTNFKNQSDRDVLMPQTALRNC